MKTLLITGGAGFLGSSIVKQFSSNYRIIVLEHSAANLERLLKIDADSLTIISSDSLEDTENIFKYEKIHAVIHCAVNYGRNGDIRNIIETNLLLPLTLLHFAVKYKTELFINTDTFFNSEKNHEYNYLKEYTLSKKQILEWLKLSAISEIKIVNLRIFHLFGENDNPDKFATDIITRLLKNVNSISLTECSQERDFIYLRDAVKAYETILKKAEIIQPGYNHFEAGTGEPVSVKFFVEKIKQLTGSTSELKFGVLQMRQNEIMQSKADNKSLSEIGWRPDYTLEEALKATIDFYKRSLEI